MRTYNLHESGQVTVYAQEEDFTARQTISSPITSELNQKEGEAQIEKRSKEKKERVDIAEKKAEKFAEKRAKLLKEKLGLSEEDLELFGL